MVKGLDIFAKHFADYVDSIVVIGGVACSSYFELLGIEFRVTKDIDIILVVEVINDNFLATFWDFIKSGEYESKERATGNRQFYRFTKPKASAYPAQLELFSRIPDTIIEKEGMKFTPIPADEEISSLSAILMDEEYYRFTIDHSSVRNGVRMADQLALVCLKAKAFMDLRERKDQGDTINSQDIKKHKNDIFRLAATLTGDREIELPESIKKDLTDFIDHLIKYPSDISPLLKSMGISNIPVTELTDQIRQTFTLE